MSLFSNALSVVKYAATAPAGAAAVVGSVGRLKAQADAPVAAKVSEAATQVIRGNPKGSGGLGGLGTLEHAGQALTPIKFSSIAAALSKFGAAELSKIGKYGPSYRDLTDANYIADHLGSTYNRPEVDKAARDAVREACAQWRPGQDLAQMVHDAVKKALTGLLPETAAPSPGEFAFPKTPEAVASQMAAEIRANGTTVHDVAEHMRNAKPPVIR